MSVNEFVKSEAEGCGLGLGDIPNFPVYHLVEQQMLKNVIAELPSGDEFFWYSDEGLELRLGTQVRDDVDHNARCSECTLLSCTINEVYSFRANLDEGRVVKLEVFSMERRNFVFGEYTLEGDIQGSETTIVVEKEES